VDEIERRTGLDLLFQVEPDVQRIIEACTDAVRIEWVCLWTTDPLQ
jgi:hypothetical protein